MQIPESCRHDVDVAVNKLVRHNNLHLHASVVSKEQVHRLVAKLLENRSDKKHPKSPPASSENPAKAVVPPAKNSPPAADPLPPIAEPRASLPPVTEPRLAPLQETPEEAPGPSVSTVPKKESPQPAVGTSSGAADSSVIEEIEDDLDFGSDLEDLDLGLDSPGKPGADSSAMNPARDPYGVGADPFATAAPALDKAEVMAGKVDLNKVDEDVLKQAKALMEEDFSQNAVKPGDAEYVYDKRVEFETVEGPGEWDDSDSDDDEPQIDAGSPLSDGGSPISNAGSPVDEDDDMYNF